MTTPALKGVTAALARSASGAVLALSEMAADDILAGLNDDQKAAIAAKMGASAAPATGAAAALAAADGEDGDDMKDKCADCGKAKEDGKCECKPAEANAAASTPLDRVKAVNASDAAKANPAAALAILADDDYASLSADAVIKLLGTVAAPTASGDDDAVGRQMLANMAANNPDLGAGNDGPSTEANHGWDSIHSEIQERRARK